MSKEERGKKREGQTDRQKRMNKAQEGYHRLFINLGKRDGFYPGELMQTLNRYVGGRQVVGHIDLLDTISYFEVPEKDAKKVMTQLTGIRYHGRIVRCNSEDDKAPANAMPKVGRNDERRTKRGKNADFIDGPGKFLGKSFSKKRDDWRQLMKPKGKELKGEMPDFTEEGWALRKPRKNKK